MAQITPDLLDAFACVLEYTPYLEYFTISGFVWHKCRLGRAFSLAKRQASEWRAGIDADFRAVFEARAS